MPKGADLHAHGGALTPVWSLIGFIESRDDILVDTNPEHKGYLMLQSKNPGASYMPLHDAFDKDMLSKAELTKL